MSGSTAPIKSNIAISLQSVRVSYDSIVALDSVTTDIPSGQMTAIIGPNGSGKSSLLKAILQLVPYSGRITFSRQITLEQMRPRLAYVPQRILVDWHFPASVQDVVAMGRYKPGAFFNRLSTQDYEAIEEALAETGLTAFAKRPVGALSGGQQQRVFIARALARKADLFILDEPFSGIDTASEENIWQIAKALTAAGKTLVMVHHDLQSVAQHFDHVILLNGYCVAAGPLHEVMQPEVLNAVYYSGLPSPPQHA
jgi:manganese/zinc/iron transport system ATP- binding protein